MAHYGANISASRDPIVAIAIIVGVLFLVLIVAGYCNWRRGRRVRQATVQICGAQHPSTRPSYSQVSPTKTYYNSTAYQNNPHPDTAPLMAPSAAYYSEAGGGFGNAGVAHVHNSTMCPSTDNAASDPIY